LHIVQPTTRARKISEIVAAFKEMLTVWFHYNLIKHTIQMKNIVIFSWNTRVQKLTANLSQCTSSLVPRRCGNEASVPQAF